MIHIIFIISNLGEKFWDRGRDPSRYKWWPILNPHELIEDGVLDQRSVPQPELYLNEAHGS